MRLGITPLLPQIREGLRVDYGLLSLVPTAFFLSTILPAAAAGPVAARVGLKRTCIGVTVLVVAAGLLCAVSYRIGMLILLLSMMGGALSSAFPTARAAVDMTAPAARSGRSMMLIGFPTLAGCAAGSMLFGRAGWQADFLIFAAIGAAGGTIAFVVLFRREYRPGHRQPFVGKSVAGNKALWLLALAKGASCAAGEGVFMFALPMLMSARGFSPRDISGIAMMGMIGSVVGMPAGSFLSDRSNRKTAVIIGLLGILPALCLIPFATGLWHFGGLMVALSFFVSATMSTGGAALSVVAAPADQAAASGLYSTVSEDVIPLTIWSSGLAASWWGVGAAFLPPLGLAVAGTCASVAFVRTDGRLPAMRAIGRSR